MAPAGEGLLAQLARGEPVTLAAVLASVFGTFGAQVTDGQAQNLVYVLSTVIGALAARKFSTPQANPAPAVKTVHLEQGGQPVTKEVPAVKPVITFAGKRPA